MDPVTASFPPDWLDPEPDGRATDLDLAVLLVNTVDLLESPPDRLTGVEWWASALSQVGHVELASELRTVDVPALRDLRSVLRAAFETEDLQAAAALLNAALLQADAVLLLTTDPAPSYTPRPDLRGMASLAARLPAAVAAHLARHGADRLGVCASDPCRCVFVDRTRAGTRRYCCTWCNDRRAARRYRQRQRQGQSQAQPDPRS